MPFKKIDIKKKIQEKIESDPEFAEIYNETQEEFEIIKQLIAARKKSGFSQTSLAKNAGLTQQVVSRLENKGHSPTLKNFLKITNALGYEIKLIEKKKPNL